MLFKLRLILASRQVFMQIRCNFPEIPFLIETQKNNFQLLNILSFMEKVCKSPSSDCKL